MTLIEKFYPVMKPWLFRMDAERAHTLTVKMMVIAHRLGMLKSVVSTPQQPRKVMGLTFPNVLGLAAGMDKSASAVDAWGDEGLCVQIGAAERGGERFVVPRQLSAVLEGVREFGGKIWQVI